MISFDEAVRIIAHAAQPLGAETVPLHQAAGRVLAKPVVAAIDSPRADVSAMDGYAVRGEDLARFPVELKVAGESLPGAGASLAVEAGSCVRIFTGAPLPRGAERIIIQEKVRREGDRAIIDDDPGPATWVRPRGADFRCGDTLLDAGRLLDPAALIAAGGADLAELEVYVRPRVALVTTGDELVQAGEARNSQLSVPDSVSAGVSALAEQWGARVVECRRVRDELPALERVAGEAVESADLVVVTGGASVGERDFAKAMFSRQGLELLFSKISMRPGKPAWFGRAAGKLILGLPGNPTSAVVTARILLAPLLARLTGRAIGDALDWEPTLLASRLPGCDARETFHRARLRDGRATLLSFQESHAQKALAAASVLVRQQAHSPAIAEGSAVTVLRL